MTMLLKRFYDPTLAQACYLVGCTISGEALVVDPNRDIAPSERVGSHRTQARLYLSVVGGNEWQYHYAESVGAVPLRDGTRFQMGKVEIEVLHVPRHTPEHLTFLVTEWTAAGPPRITEGSPGGS